MRRITAVAAMAVGTLALAGALAAPASAVPDPVATVDCAVADVTGLVDPANLGVPAEVPGAGCLAP
ncbi:hypothetical protein [Streptomyces flavofungini]|uniref:Secreted protein n=1 Tax=Streptomyces flavofungini TaxID=68200 RepID=A0ABS0XDR7_9ACTN|nr:hypothetical protein [Streptomyces flavofungini]MBJ3811357.1 hypothetical protein [Streptomyces flavofungini]GHC42853.1 hypothetical protein GCM10010349_03930 [Streptomyces flavofungini]